MAVTQTLYLKAEQNVEVRKRDITLGDIMKMECQDPHIVSQIKALKFMKVPPKGQHRYVVSILKIISRIHQEYPNLDIQNLGSPDIIVTYEEQKVPNQFVHIIKGIFVSVIVLIGSAFSIMAFNNDVDLSKLLTQIYEKVTGSPKIGFGILELSYCIGVAVGILVFFNHFGGKRFTVDPTPMEVEMRLYEKDIQTTLIENYSREEKELDVDTTNSIGGHRT